MIEKAENIVLGEQALDFLNLEEVFDLTWGKPAEVVVDGSSTANGLPLLSVEEIIQKVELGKKFHLEWMTALGSVGGLFAHGGALCAHCVTGVGEVMSNAGSFGVAGLPGVGLGHFHEDGSWHAEDEHKQPSKTLDTTPELNHSSTPIDSGQANITTMNFFPENTISLSEAVAFGETGISVHQFVEDLAA